MYFFFFLSHRKISEFWKGKDVPLFDSNTWQWFWQFEGKPVSVVKPFYGPLAGTFKQECRVQGKQGWREQEAGFTLFISAITVNCAHGCVYTVPGSLYFTEHRPGASRGSLEKRDIKSVLSFNFSFQQTLNSSNSFNFTVTEYLLCIKHYVKHLTFLMCKLGVMTVSIS